MYDKELAVCKTVCALSNFHNSHKTFFHSITWVHIIDIYEVFLPICARHCLLSPERPEPMANNTAKNQSIIIIPHERMAQKNGINYYMRFHRKSSGWLADNEKKSETITELSRRTCVWHRTTIDLINKCFMCELCDSFFFIARAFHLFVLPDSHNTRCWCLPLCICGVYVAFTRQHCLHRKEANDKPVCFEIC